MDRACGGVEKGRAGARCSRRHAAVGRRREGVGSVGGSSGVAGARPIDVQTKHGTTEHHGQSVDGIRIGSQHVFHPKEIKKGRRAS